MTRKAKDARYEASPKGKARVARYRESAKGVFTEARFRLNARMRDHAVQLERLEAHNR